MNDADTERFITAIREEIDRGNLIEGDGGITELGYGVLCVKSLGNGVTLGDVARNIVPHTKGIITCTSTGLNFVYGKAGTKGRLIMKRSIPAIVESREAYHRFTGIMPNSYSVSAVARLFLSGLTPTRWHGSDERIMPEGTWHFQHCIPGIYPEVRVIDCKSYYYQLLKRADRLEYRVVRPGKLTKVRTDDREMGYFRDMLEAIEPAKMLRNTIVGCMAGGGDKLMAFTSKGNTVKRFYITPQFGPFRSLGLLIVATGAELCKNACLQVGGIYGNIDCVAVTSKIGNGSIPAWSDYGIITEIKAQGKGEFCHIGSWSCGDFQTIPYESKNREYLTTNGENTLTASWAKQWL